MKTVDELIYYCKQDRPVGALLLTGEWGCGKTYLIDNTLKEALSETHLIVRISLFGVSSIEEFHQATKSCWIEEAYSFLDKAKRVKKIIDKFSKFTEAISNNPLKGLTGGLLSIDFTHFIRITNKVKNKKVILVFDDFERSKLSTVELLGSINEYCENQHFNVIIIADEEKLGKQQIGNELTFSNIKEKVVNRTVLLEPDHEEVIKNVIDDFTDEKYRLFLHLRINDIIMMFSGRTVSGDNLDIEAKKNISSIRRQKNVQNDDEGEKENGIMKKRPHNIRSIKAALQDFQRIYYILNDYEVKDAYRWLWAFLSFSMAAKANLIPRDEEYGYLFRTKNMDLLYPGYYDSRFFPDSLAYWVMEGKWEEEALRQYISDHYPKEKEKPSLLVKNTRIDWLNEESAQSGMDEIIEQAYNGTLSYNEYVMLIINVKLARQYGLCIKQVDWGKIQTAIQQKINNDIYTKDYQEEYSRNRIGKLDEYTDEEKETYRLIENIREKKVIILEKNRREYMDQMRNDPESALKIQEYKELKCFDKEMAKATLEGYSRAENIIQAKFPESFNNAWSGYTLRFGKKDSDIKMFNDGFRELERGLKELVKEYENKPFKKSFTIEFINTINQIVSTERDVQQ